MERLSNIRIHTLCKSFPTMDTLVVVGVKVVNNHIIIVADDDTTYDLGIVSATNLVANTPVDSPCEKGGNVARSNVLATLLRGIDGKDGKTQDLSEYYKKSEVDGKLEQKQDTISNLDTIRTNAEKGATAVQPSELAKVATSGSYNDLSDKPHIPAEVTEQKVSDWGFTKNTGTYIKPESGIPRTDLDSFVRTSLDKANIAFQDLESKTDIVASQIFLGVYTVSDNFQIFSHKRGYEEHNREVCQRLIENCFTDKVPNNEMFFVTINGIRDGIPYMETAILESNAEGLVYASFVKGNVTQSSSIVASIGFLSIDAETLRNYVESGGDEFYWRYISIRDESDVYVTEFNFDQITTNGTAVSVSPELVNAIYNNRIIVIPSKRGYYIATNTYSASPNSNVSIGMQIATGTYIYSVLLGAKGPAPQTVRANVRVIGLLSGTLNTINGATLLRGLDMKLVSSISLNGKIYTPLYGAVDLGNIESTEGVQSDWLDDDRESMGYVRNRTHFPQTWAWVRQGMSFTIDLGITPAKSIDNFKVLLNGNIYDLPTTLRESMFYPNSTNPIQGIECVGQDDNKYTYQSVKDDTGSGVKLVFAKKLDDFYISENIARVGTIEDDSSENTIFGTKRYSDEQKRALIKEYMNVKPTVRIFHSTNTNKSSIYAYHPYLNEFGDGELVVMRYGKTKMAKWVLDGDIRNRKYVTKTGWRECLGAPINLSGYVGEQWKDARFTEPAKLYVGQNNYRTVLEGICARATYDKIRLVSDSGEVYEGLVSMAQLMALYGMNAISVLREGFYYEWERSYYGDAETPPNYSIFGGQRDRVTLGVALRVLNPEFQKLLDEGILNTDQFNNRRWYYDVDNDITIPKYFYSDVCEMFLSKGSMQEMINLNLPRMPRLSLK